MYTESFNPYEFYLYFIEEAQEKAFYPKLHIIVQSHAFNSVSLPLKSRWNHLLYCCNLPKEKATQIKRP